MSTLPEMCVGDPIRHQSLAVFPLFSTIDAKVDYLLSDEAIRSGVVAVEEVSESGSVPNLRVTNSGDSRVLFLEGEELRGAKQNRVLNTSVLVAAHSQTAIPVSCVEQGRWRYRSKQFASSDSHSSSKLRHILKKSSYAAMKEGRGYTSDQTAVWSEVSRQMSSLDASSPTQSMSDTFELNLARLDEFRERIQYVEGATGVAVAVGNKVVALDIFDKPATCARVWDRLLSGVVMDSLEDSNAEKTAEKADVARLIAGLNARAWEPAPAVGEGREFRLDPDAATHASALVFADSMIHGSVVVAS